MTEEPEDEKPIGLKAREEKIASIALAANIDCNMMDAKTRKVLLYLVNQELKKLNSFPSAWVKDSKEELQGIKAGIEMCKAIRGKKDAEQGPSAEGKSQESSPED